MYTLRESYSVVCLFWSYVQTDVTRQISVTPKFDTIMFPLFYPIHLFCRDSILSVLNIE